MNAVGDGGGVGSEDPTTQPRGHGHRPAEGPRPGALDLIFWSAVLVLICYFWSVFLSIICCFVALHEINIFCRRSTGGPTQVWRERRHNWRGGLPFFLNILLGEGFEPNYTLYHSTDCCVPWQQWMKFVQCSSSFPPVINAYFMNSKYFLQKFHRFENSKYFL